MSEALLAAAGVDAIDTLYDAALPWPAQRVTRAVWRGSVVTGGERDIAEEIPVAFTYNGSAHAVMMASPCDLEDFAVGFSLTEGILSDPAQIESLDVISTAEGIELRMWIARSQEEALRQRQRRLVGPSGCGLCGIESLTDALRPLRQVYGGTPVSASAISAALDEMTALQQLNRLTRAVHAAAFGRPGQRLIVREDVGRHNALDKLAGALAREQISADPGFVVLSSRVSIEMVQKAAAIGAPIIVAVSAPTALAVRACHAAGITLIAIARQDGFELFTHPHRVAGGDSTTFRNRGRPLSIDEGHPRSSRMATTDAASRHRDKNGAIGKKHGNTLIRTLRKSYGADFAAGCDDNEKLSDVLEKLDEPSLSSLIRDHGSGRLAQICSQ